jgi:4-amino-4-deoxy-L-arabinose transferase-like glycosyltransferase
MLSETLFTLIFLLSILFLLFAERNNSLKYAAVAGVLMGLGILTRSIILFYPIIGFVLLAWKAPTLKRGLVVSSVFIASCALILAPWVIRNAIVVKVPTVTTITAHNLYNYNALTLYASQTGQPESEVREAFDQKVEDTLAEKKLPDTEANRYHLMNEMAKQIIFSDPLGYIVSHIKSDFNSLLPDTALLEVLGIHQGDKGTLRILKQQGLFAAINHYFGEDTWLILILLPVFFLLGATYLGWGVATISMLRQGNYLPLLFLLLPILYSLILPGSPSQPRFRVPVMPYISILGAQGLYLLLTYFKHKETK